MTDEKIAIRKPPVDAVMAKHLPAVRGKCRWCGLPVEERTAHHGMLKFWHDACEAIFHIIIRPDSARRAVFARDKGICFDCGEDWSQMSVFRPAYPVGKHWILPDMDPEHYSPGRTPGSWCQLSHEYEERGILANRRNAIRYPYVELQVISLWHVDHKIPLWKVAHLPPAKRIIYFMLENLITRCERCHHFKTKAEAAERAKYKRLGKPPPIPSLKAKGKSKQKIRSRGFQKQGKTKWPKRKFPKRKM